MWRSMNGILTKHAELRSAARGIPPLIIDWLMEFGSETGGSNGATIRFFDKTSRKCLKRLIGSIPYRRMQDLLDCYLIERNGQVITVGHRYRKIMKR